MTSNIKDFLLTWKIDLEKEDIYSEAFVEGGPKVARLSEDFFLQLFHTFLSNRKVIDKKMDKYIQLSIIKPSKSP